MIAIVWIGLGTAAVVVSLALLSAAVGNGRFASVATVDLDERPVPPEPFHPPNPDLAPVRFVIAGPLAAQQTAARYRGLVDALARHLKRTVEVEVGASYAIVNERLRARDCDVAIVSPYAFVVGERDFGMELAATMPPTAPADAGTVVVVRAEAPEFSLGALKGSRLALADPLSYGGWIVLATELLDRGEDPERYFAQRLYTAGDDNAVLAVLGGYAQAAAVNAGVYRRMVARTPALGDALRVLQHTATGPSWAVAVHPQLDPNLRSALFRALRKLGESERGRDLQEHLGIAGFSRPDAGVYDSVRADVKRLER